MKNTFGWFRLYAEFATDPKVQSMPEHMQRRLVMLFCLRCSNGHVTFHETEIAWAMRISEAEVAETKALFLAKGFIDEGWGVINWNKRQYISDSSTDRVRRHRERRETLPKQDETFRERRETVTVTSPDTDTDTDTEQIQRTASLKKREAAPRGSRLTEESLPVEWLRWVTAELGWPDRRTRSVFDSFRDYWVAVPGAKGVKLDWLATWRGWCRRENERNPERQQPALQHYVDPFRGIPKFRAGGSSEGN